MAISSDQHLKDPLGLEPGTDEAARTSTGTGRPGPRPDRPGVGVRRLERALGPRAVGLWAALATALVLGWGLGASALWLDEGATVLATQRTWSDLWRLDQGAEAPLVPYYALLKLFTGVADVLVPALSGHPELLYRLPSFGVTVLAGGLLAAWTSRFAPLRLVVLSMAMLLLSGGFSHYGQEARPYAAVMFLAVVATVGWSVLITDRRLRWPVGYALSVGLMVSMHTLSAGLVAAHLVAALVCPQPGARRRVFWTTVGAGAAGGLLAAPMALTTAANGTGPGFVYPHVSARLVLVLFGKLFTAGDPPVFLVGPVVMLGLLGLVQVRSEEYAFIARLAACWAFVPLAAMAPVMAVRPNLLVPRYALFVVPAWALLAGLGVLTAAHALARAVAVGVLVPIVAVVLVATTAVLQANTLTQLRAPAGHTEDIRPAVAAVKEPEVRNLDIVVSSNREAVLVGVYGRKLEKRLLGQVIQRDGTQIWPEAMNPKAVRKVLRKRHRVLLMLSSSSSNGCNQELGLPTAPLVEACQPARLRRQHYHLERILSTGGAWTVAVMAR